MSKVARIPHILIMICKKMGVAAKFVVVLLLVAFNAEDSYFWFVKEQFGELAERLLHQS